MITFDKSAHDQARILIVDDKPDNIFFLENLLGQKGFVNVQSTLDSREVKGLVLEQEPDLILLDLMMPHVDGFAVMAELAEVVSPETYLPVLILTADNSMATRRRALAEGAMDFLTKPLDAVEVLQRTRNLLHTRWLHRQQRRHNELLEQTVRERTRALIGANRALESANGALMDANLEILSRLARAAEYRDDDTGEHTLRVGRLAQATALGLGLSTDFAALILRAARLHDIGKIGIPDSILLKPGRLTDEERRIMETHCRIGADLLAGSNSDLLRLAERIALSHHERMDGHGYPLGLSGEAIPIEARIVAVADVFDALTHKRPYKEAWPLAEAVTLLHEERAQSFDPEVVDAFLRALETTDTDTGLIDELQLSGYES